MGEDTLFRIFNEAVPLVLDDELDSSFEKTIFGIVAWKAYRKVTLQNSHDRYLKTHLRRANNTSEREAAKMANTATLNMLEERVFYKSFFIITHEIT